METLSSKKICVFRGKESILRILDEYKKSGLSIKAFCLQNKINPASFHNWKKKYCGGLVNPAKRTGFAAVQITVPPAVAEPLFVSVKEIKIYQWVTAAYLKELLP
jgi:hypothetical protein